jgi:hypothetical protein
MIPGLWDMHVHARGTPALLSDNEAWLTVYIANGITSVAGKLESNSCRTRS